MYAEDIAENQQGYSYQWYAVQVGSGCEKRVKVSLEQRIPTLEDSYEDLRQKIVQIEIPQTPIVKIRKDGSRQTDQEKSSLAMS